MLSYEDVLMLMLLSILVGGLALCGLLAMFPKRRGPRTLSDYAAEERRRKVHRTW